MKFSVLISVYYKENPIYFRNSLRSIFLQTLLPNEVVLIEDGPLTSELYDVVEFYKNKINNFRIFCLEKNQGLGKALDFGLNKCRYDYVARMDSDDECYPTRFEKQIAFLENHKNIDVVGSLTTEFTENNNIKKILSIKEFPETEMEIRSYAKRRCPVEHPAVIFRKSSVLHSGGYKDCYLFEDYNLWVRMLMDGACFYNIQEPLLYFRMTSGSFDRRGGLKYAVSEIKALYMFKHIGFLSPYQFLICIITRLPVRLMPNNIRRMIYNKFLRKHLKYDK